MKLQFLGQSGFSTNITDLGTNPSNIGLSQQDIKILNNPFVKENSLIG